MEYRGVCEPVLKPQTPWEDPYPVNCVQSRDQNRTREIRPSGIAGRLVETWIMEITNRARTAETPKQTSYHLRPYAPHFYPDQRSNPSVWSMPEDGKEYIFYHTLLSSPSSFGSKAKNLLNWCEAPTKAKQAQSSAPVGHMSGLSRRRKINVSIM